jgi:phosphate transport system protein
MVVLPTSDLAVGSIEARVRSLFAMVGDAVPIAMDAFLSGDREAAQSVISADPRIDELQKSIERDAEARLCDRSDLTVGDIKDLVAVIRIVPELERSGDLVEHIAMRTRCALIEQVSPKARGRIAQMGEIATAMWRLAGSAFPVADPTTVAKLRVHDDELDNLHVLLTAELSSGALPTAVAIEVGLVARFLERLGDHAVNVARRLERDGTT